jgi:release factor glutamine methyltransferase
VAAEALGSDHAHLVRRLASAGCIAPEEEADELVLASRSSGRSLEDLVARRIEGEPLAWITGSVRFCDLTVRVDSGVYVPRPQTQALARRAAELLPSTGVAVDLCTGSGAVALVLASERPRARVLATDVDRRAVACARANGVEALLGDLDEPLPRERLGRVEVLAAVVPYVPTEELHLLPRDVVEHEPRAALDGGPGGTAMLRRAAGVGASWLGTRGALLLELGGDQADELSADLADLEYVEIRVHRDEDGRDRAIEARRP